MKNKKVGDLTERTIFLEIDVIELCSQLPGELSKSNFADQLIHYASAIGGNYREAQRSRTRMEYKKKMAAIIADIGDLVYFLDLLNELNEAKKEILDDIINEANEILIVIKESIGKGAAIKLNRKLYVRQWNE